MFAMMMRNPAQLMFLFTSLILAYLVLPPFFFILHTSLVVDRGLQAGSFTIQHFKNIVESLGDVKTLLMNSMIFSVGSAAIALVYGTALAWLAERSDAPFRKLAYVTAYVSFAIPGIIKVVGWIMLMGPKAGILNAPIVALTGAPLFNIFSLSGMVLVESFLWIPIVFLLDGNPFPFHGPIVGGSRDHLGKHRLAGLPQSYVPPGIAECARGLDLDLHPLSGGIRDSGLDWDSRRRRSAHDEDLSANQGRIDSKIR